MRAGGRDNKPVGRVAVKRRRQRIEREHHFNAERHYRNHSFIGCAGQPFGDGQRQFQPPFGMQDPRFQLQRGC